MTVTDAIFMWALALALAWVAADAIGASPDLSSLVHHANMWLAQVRDDLDLPSVSEALHSFDDAFDGAKSSLFG